MPEVPSPLARRPAGRCSIAKVALLAGLAAVAAAPGAFAQSRPAAQPRRRRQRRRPAPPAAAVDQQVQSLKSDVLDLNRDLFVLEQELLYPANTQVAVFVSHGCGHLLRPRLGAAEDRRQGSRRLSLHAARGPRAGAGRGAAALRRQPQSRQARARGLLHRQGPARPSTTPAAPPWTSRRTSAPSISSSRSPTIKASSSRSSASRTGIDPWPARRACASSPP